MRTTLLALFILTSLNGWAQWAQSNMAGFNANIRCVQMLSGTNGYWAGDKFAVTSNSGVTWTSVNSSTMNLFACYGMYFFNMNNGIVSGHNFASGNDEIQTTTNGGTSWTLAYTGNNTIQNINFVNANDGYAFEQPNVILKSTNGGASWAPVSSLPLTTVNCINFPSDTTGYAACNNYIKKTSDGGTTWSTVYSSSQYFTAINFINDTLGYAGGNDTIYRTTNGGATWTTNAIRVTFQGAESIYCSSIDTAYMGGFNTNYILRTTNRGLAWETQYVAAYEINAFSFSGGVGVAVGNNTEVETTNDAGGTSYPIGGFVLTSTICDSVVTLQNLAYSGYTFSWYFNDSLYSHAYDFSKNIYSGASPAVDTITLVTSNGQHNDTTTTHVTKQQQPKNPDMSRFTFSSDTICPGASFVAHLDSPNVNSAYMMTVNGTLIVSDTNSTIPLTFTATGLSDSARVVLTGVGFGTCGRYNDSIVKIVRMPTVSPLLHVEATDSFVCLNTTVPILISNPSPWYKYYILSMHDTLQGNSSNIILLDSLIAPPTDTTFRVIVLTNTITNCGVYQLPIITVSINQPGVSYTVADSMVFIGDTIYLTNHSHADSYNWFFDPTANRLSDTSTNSYVTYHTTGDKPIMLVGNTPHHCSNDTALRTVFVGAHVPSDSVGVECVTMCMDTGINIHNFGLTAYHADRFGNIYEAGIEQCYPSAAGYSSTGTAAYLVKTDNTGHRVWNKNSPFSITNNPGFYSSLITGITTDPNGNVYVAGSFGNTTSGFIFDSLSNSNTVSFNTSNGVEYFIAKFDSTGEHQWMIYSSQQGMYSYTLGAADIKYIDDNHIYALVMGSQYDSYVSNHFTDSTRPENFEDMNLLQINSAGRFVNNYPVHTLSPHDVQCSFNPVPYWTTITNEISFLGPRLYPHADCNISVVGIFTDSLYFPGADTIGSFGRASMFAATFDPAIGWTGAHTLFGSNFLLNAPYITNTIDRYSNYIVTGQFTPRFDFDSHKNIYITAIADTLLLSDSSGQGKQYAGFGDKYPIVVAKFDPNGHNLWMTQSLRYNNRPFIAGINLSPDESKLILTGNYSDAVNLSSVQGAPSLLHTGIPQGQYIAAMNTSGYVQWIKDVSNPVIFENLYSVKDCNGNIYTLSTDSFNDGYQCTYNIYGNCNVPDTCPAHTACIGISIALSSGANPACAGSGWQFTAYPYTIGAASYQWLVDSTNVGSDTTVLITNTLTSGQVVSCIMTTGGLQYNSNTIILQVFAPDTPVISHSQLILTSSAAITYQWYLNGVSLPGDTLQSISLWQSGNYTVMISDSNGCIQVSTPYQVTNVGISNISDSLSVSIYPNPATESCTITIHGAADTYMASLMNITGDEIDLLGQFKVPTFTFSVATCAKGVYMLKITNSSGESTIKKLVIE